MENDRIKLAVDGGRLVAWSRLLHAGGRGQAERIKKKRISIGKWDSFCKRCLAARAYQVVYGAFAPSTLATVLNGSDTARPPCWRCGCTRFYLSKWLAQSQGRGDCRCPTLSLPAVAVALRWCPVSQANVPNFHHRTSHMPVSSSLLATSFVILFVFLPLPLLGRAHCWYHRSYS